jgi:hypothetical protein
LIGGIAGAAVGFLARGASIDHQGASGASMVMPGYVAGGALLGCVVGALAAR